MTKKVAVKKTRLRQKGVVYIQLRTYLEEAGTTRLGAKRGQIRHVPGGNIRVQGWPPADVRRIIKEAFEREAAKEAESGVGQARDLPEEPGDHE